MLAEQKKEHYSPLIYPDQVHELYKLAKSRKRPMTKVLRSILTEYFEQHQQELSAMEEIVTSTERKEIA